MLSSYMTREEIQSSIAQLDQALYNHNQWSKELVRTLVCRLPGDEHDLAPRSYEQCRFGQWYFGEKIPTKLREHAGFVAIGEEHERMHKLCTQLLIENTNKNVNPMNYDKFANALERMRLEMNTLKRELEDALYNHDALTGAITRISMLPILREQQELLKRHGDTSVIAMLDIDYFKDINDKYGHPSGDHVLTAVVEFSIAHIRPYDKIFRYGGEEFLFLLQNTDMKTGSEMMERIRDGISKIEIDIGSQHTVQTTVSFGVTLLDAHTPVEESIDRADKALYEAKQNGRNCLREWTPS